MARDIFWQPLATGCLENPFHHAFLWLIDRNACQIRQRIDELGKGSAANLKCISRDKSIYEFNEVALRKCLISWKFISDFTC